MPEDVNINDIIAQLQQHSNDRQPNLEDILIQHILNPFRLERQIIRIVDNPESDQIYEIREGSIINQNGFQEEIQELLINVRAFADGTPMNIFGIVKCENCGSIVRDQSTTLCACCGKMCCLSPNCLQYSRLTEKIYCSKFHKYLGLLGIRLR